MSKPIAVLCSDLHLSLKQPACRADKDWMEVQSHYLKQLYLIAAGKPIVCAGDIFDRWNPPPELINFALENLPDKMICVPGQHDLPNHRIEDMNRSGYGVLVNAEKIINCTEMAIDKSELSIYGFGWGQGPLPLTRKKRNDVLDLAVVHRYVWTINHSYPGATEDAHLINFMPALKGYDAAVFGDNHKGFYCKLKTGTHVLNCGTFIRRKSDEISYHPQVGVLYDDGSIRPKKLDTSIDRFHENSKQREETEFDMQAFLEQLEGLGEHGLDFREAIKNQLRKEDLDPKTKSIILKAIEQ